MSNNHLVLHICSSVIDAWGYMIELTHLRCIAFENNMSGTYRIDGIFYS